MTDQLRLEYNLAPAAGAVVLTYKLHNGSDRRIFLASHLPIFDGENWVPNAERVYTFWEANEVLHLSKRLWQVPDDIEVYMPEVPFLTSLAAGETFRQHVTLALPITLDLPYATEEAGDEISGQSQSVVFSLGCVPGSAAALGGALYPQEHLLSPDYGAAIQYQQIIIGRKVLISLPVQG